MKKTDFKKMTKKDISDITKLFDESTMISKPYRRQSASEKRKATAKEYGLDEKIKEGETLEKAYKRLAKKADRRLRALEALAYDKHFQGIKTFAYAKAMRDIEKWSGKGAKRFDTKAPESKQQIREKIGNILNFLNSPTSMKKTTVEIYKKRVDTLNKKYKDFGLHMTWQEFADFCQDNAFERGLLVNISSDTLFIKYATTKKERAKEIKELLQSQKKHKRTSESDVNAAIRDIILEDGKNDVADFLSSDMSASPFTFD